MKLVTFQDSSQTRIGIVVGGNTLALSDLDANLPTEMNELLPLLPELTERLPALAANATPLSPDVRFGPPIPNPEKIICIGLNYADHAAETGSEIPPEPVVFNKFPTTLRGPEDNIELPPQSDQVDYEAELVIVIGREAKNVTEADAMQYVAGYTCGHDVSARDWQKYKPQGQWLCGKSFDSFAPIGPVLVTADEIPDPNQLDIKFHLNGDTLQNSNTRQFIFNVQQLVAYLSQVCTLKPGDLIFTGTPPGVGLARKPQVFLKDGDVAEVEIEGIGTLRNPVVR